MNSRLRHAELAPTLRLCLLVIPALLACGDSPSGPQTPTGLRITIKTLGLDIPGAFNIRLTGGTVLYTQLRPTDGIPITQLKPGSYTVSLENSPTNCAVADGNTRVVDVVRGALTQVEFDVTCVAVSGVLRVSVTTAGVDPDPTGYRLTLQTGTVLQVSANSGVATFNSVPAGPGTVEITGVASNCVLNSPASQAFSITTGKITRDTARAAFSVACSAAEKIAFSRHVSSGNLDWIVFAYSDGSEDVVAFGGLYPSWSSDAGGLAFFYVNCDSYYYYYGCSKQGLAFWRPSTGRIVTLTKDTLDADPEWRPTDGGAIAFGRAGALYLINADGQGERPIISTPVPSLRAASQPTWSPDATKIAFRCEMENGWTDICTIGSDGTGFVRLTADSSTDKGPAWSPDGTQIAFSTSDATGGSQIALIGSGGGTITRLMAGLNPAWSPDGKRLLFEASPPKLGIFRLTLGSGAIQQVTFDNDHNPVFRP